MERARLDSFHVKPIFVPRIWKYVADHGELAQVRAAIVQMSSRMLPVTSDSKNWADALFFLMGTRLATVTVIPLSGVQSPSPRFRSNRAGCNIFLFIYRARNAAIPQTL